jgi:hypothetical protein
MTSSVITSGNSGRHKAYLVGLLVLSIIGSIPVLIRLVSDAIILTSGTFVGVDINAYFFSLLLFMVFLGVMLIATDKLNYKNVRIFSYHIESVPELVGSLWLMSSVIFILFLFVPLYVNMF